MLCRSRERCRGPAPATRAEWQAAQWGPPQGPWGAKQEKAAARVWPGHLQTVAQPFVHIVRPPHTHGGRSDACKVVATPGDKAKCVLPQEKSSSLLHHGRSSCPHRGYGRRDAPLTLRRGPAEDRRSTRSTRTPPVLRACHRFTHETQGSGDVAAAEYGYPLLTIYYYYKEGEYSATQDVLSGARPYRAAVSCLCSCQESKRGKGDIQLWKKLSSPWCGHQRCRLSRPLPWPMPDVGCLCGRGLCPSPVGTCGWAASGGAGPRLGPGAPRTQRRDHAVCVACDCAASACKAHIAVVFSRRRGLKAQRPAHWVHCACVENVQAAPNCGSERKHGRV